MLFNHAMGNTSEAESLILSCHIAYCPICKKEIEKYEKIGGYFLSNHDRHSVSKGLWKNILDKVEGLDQEQKQNNFFSHNIKSYLTEEPIKIPSFLTEYLEKMHNTESWKSTINNVRYKDIKFKGSNFKGKLLEIPAGKMMPKHGHESYEATLVLHGGYKDEKGEYNLGDLVLASSDEVHSPIADAETGCLCLVVYSGEIQFKGLLGPILNLSKF